MFPSDFPSRLTPADLLSPSAHTVLTAGFFPGDDGPLVAVVTDDFFAGDDGPVVAAVTADFFAGDEAGLVGLVTS